MCFCWCHCFSIDLFICFFWDGGFDIARVFLVFAHLFLIELPVFVVLYFMFLLVFLIVLDSFFVTLKFVRIWFFIIYLCWLCQCVCL